MYFVKYGEKYLHDPRVAGCMLLDLSLDGEENSCGFCDFTIYPNHPMYDKLKERDADNPIEVYDDDILLFVGFIYELGKEFYLDGHVRCKGELDYLSETIIRPYSTNQKGYGLKAPNRPNEYFEWLINQHNSQVGANKQFVIGINEAFRFENTLFTPRENTDYPKTIDEIKSKLLDMNGGYIRTRHENGIRYIDYLYEWTDTNTQVLDFGVNLSDYSQTDDSLEVATAVIPLGAKMSETEYPYNDGYFRTSDSVPSSSKEYFTQTETGYAICSDSMTSFEAGVQYYEYNEDNDESDLLLSIDGNYAFSYDAPGYIKSGDMIFNEEGFHKYGFILATYKNTELKTKGDLINAGILALKRLISPKRTIEIKAVDMHLINRDIKPIRIGEYVRVRSKPHNLDSFFLCASISLDMNNPESSLYTLGTTFDTLTGQQNKRINALNSSVNKQYQEIQNQNGTVNKATKETTQIANDALSNATQAAADALAAMQAADDSAAQVVIIEGHVTSAQSAASDAQAAASQAIEAANSAVSTANTANSNASQANTKADQAITSAGNAIATAEAAQTEAEEATEEATQVRNDLTGQITTLSNTMTADYARKTELTSTESTLRSEISQSAAIMVTTVEQTYAKKTELTEVANSLQTQITQNAQQIQSTASSVTFVNTAANNAQNAANDAQAAADAAQTTANTAVTDASTAQQAANAAAQAASTAQTKADQAADNLAAAEAELQTLQSQANATDEDLAAAQAAVTAAQNAADAAQSDATAAANAASTAQSTANTAVTNAATAHTKANEAKSAADAAQEDVDALGVRMTSAETSITQNADAITLRATKTELNTAKNELSADISELQVQADGISSRVTTTEGDITSMKQTADSFTWMAGVTADISEAQDTADDAVSAYNDLQIGGRNLLNSTDTTRLNIISEWSIWGAGSKTLENAWIKCSYNNASASLNYGVRTPRSFDFISGQRYTMSFEAYATQNMDINYCYVMADGDTNVSTGASFAVTTTPQKFSFTFYKNYDRYNCALLIGTSDSTALVDGAAFYIRKVKFEYGTKATDWTPSIEDTNNDILDATKTATNYMNFANDTGLIVGNMTDEQLGENIQIQSDAIHIRNGSESIASFLSTGIEFDKPSVFTADGLLLNNGDAYTYLGRNTILWSGGTDGYWMNDTQSVTLSSNITRQLSGAIFAWSLYQNGAAVDSDWHLCFVPKYQVTNFGGNIVRMYDAYLGMNKVLYVSNSRATGHDQNDLSGTTNGIAWDNSKWVLRYVVGV